MGTEELSGQLDKIAGSYLRWTSRCSIQGKYSNNSPSPFMLQNWSLATRQCTWRQYLICTLFVQDRSTSGKFNCHGNWCRTERDRKPRLFRVKCYSFSILCKYLPFLRLEPQTQAAFAVRRLGGAGMGQVSFPVQSPCWLVLAASPFTWGPARGRGMTGRSELPASRTLHPWFPPLPFVVPASLCFLY